MGVMIIHEVETYSREEMGEPQLERLNNLKYLHEKVGEKNIVPLHY
jgi:hypothetical protein